MFRNLQGKIIKNYDKLILAFILILASFLRLYKISDYMTFLGDEGRDALVIKHLLEGKFTLLGPTSSAGGFFYGPIYYYFITPFYWIFNGPVGSSIMVALFGIATVYLIYKFGNLIFNKQVGIIASLLYAISPLVLSYSRSSWNPNILPFFSLLSIYFLYKAVTNKSNFYFLIVGILLGISLQLHYLVIFLFVVIGLYVLISLWRQKIKILQYYLAIFFGFLIGLSPFLAFELRHGFPNTISVIKFIFGGKDTGFNLLMFANTVFEVFVRMFSRLTFFSDEFNFSIFKSNINTTIFYIFIILISLISTFYLIFQFWNYRKVKEKSNKYLLITIWFLVGLFLFGFYKKQIYDYHLAFLYPVPFLIIANFINYIFNKKIVFKIIGTIFLLWLVGLNLSGMPFRYAPNKQFEQAQNISRSVFDAAKDRPFNFALITGGNSDHAYRYFLETWGNTPITIQNSVVDPKRKTVTDQLIIVCESLPCYPLGNPLWEVAGFGQAEIEGKWNVSVVEVYKLKHYKN